MLDDTEDPNQKKICYNCVREGYLSEEIRKQGKRVKCDYCGKFLRCYSMEKMAGRIEIAFDQHYVRTSDQPNDFEHMLMRDRESSYEWERHGEPVVYAIMNAAEIPEKAAEDIQEILCEKYGDFDAAAIGEETEFADDSHYEEKGTDGRALQEQWDAFERSLKSEARFFSRSAAAHLASIFDGIDKMRTTSGRPLVIDAGPGTTLASVFRARVFQSLEKLEEALCRPDQQLGSPPSKLSIAGRMNARGISVFYGANDPTVAIAEVRPPVGSKVLVGQFQIIKPLRLLDLAAFADIRAFGSIFDSETAGKLERAMFLRSLSRRITQPVMPDDEDFEYLATQSIADFLATESAVPLDGILFPSVQAADGSLNLVLFHKSARVETLEFPEGTELTAHTGSSTEDGWEVDYSVWEEVPPTKPKTDFAEDFPGPLFLPHHWNPDTDYREPALRVVLDSIKVHEVQRVQFCTMAFEVVRHRMKKSKHFTF